MSNEGMQQLEKEEKVRKAAVNVLKCIRNLQWEMARVSPDAQSEFKKLEREATALHRLCR